MSKKSNAEIFEALTLFEKERGIPVEYMIEKISNAIMIAVKKSHGGNDDISINIDPEKNQFDVIIRKEAVEEVTDPNREILLEEARKYSKKAQLGDLVQIKLETKEFGRIAAQTAKHVIRQGIREVERGQALMEFQSKHQELVTAEVERIDEKTGAATLIIGSKAEAILTKNEMVGNEDLHEGDR
ncbi:MAG: transcription termination/antitermination protein NusA, partial [Clostridia bacterium]|nr:transcription termination/antitermination protein NusA [Clostridia bacterium]